MSTRRSPSPSILDLVASLVDKSLVFRVDSAAGEPRFGMLETIREYAVERLAQHGEEATARQAHADYFLGLAERAAPALEGPDQAAWLDRLDEERANLGAVARWSTEQGDAETVLRLSAALWRFWWARNSGEESRARVDEIWVVARSAAPSAARARSAPRRRGAGRAPRRLRAGRGLLRRAWRRPARSAAGTPSRAPSRAWPGWSIAEAGSRPRSAARGEPGDLARAWR